jgi:hypothetical protein
MGEGCSLTAGVRAAPCKGSGSGAGLGLSVDREAPPRRNGTLLGRSINPF